MLSRTFGSSSRLVDFFKLSDTSGLWSNTNQTSTPALYEELEINISITRRGETPAMLAIAPLES